MSTTAPYGTWPSPITPGTITTRTVRLSQVRVDGPDTYWVEQRASQAAAMCCCAATATGRSARSCR